MAFRGAAALWRQFAGLKREAYIPLGEWCSQLTSTPWMPSIVSQVAVAKYYILIRQPMESRCYEGSVSKQLPSFSGVGALRGM